jgi:hypothetical protein
LSRVFGLPAPVLARTPRALLEGSGANFLKCMFLSGK